MKLWTIYDHPKDHPEHFVVRAWTVINGEMFAELVHERFDSLNAARNVMRAAGRKLLGREPDDDPCIVETWA